MSKATWKIEWSDALSMANPEIDAEHRHFIELVNTLNSAIIDQRHNQADIEHIMNLILEDAIAHFSNEERLFAEKDFPGAQRHTRIHAALISRFRQVLADIHNSGSGREWVDAGLTIKHLLVNHIVIEDAKYMEYLRTEQRL